MTALRFPLKRLAKPPFPLKLLVASIAHACLNWRHYNRPAK